MESVGTLSLTSSMSLLFYFVFLAFNDGLGAFSVHTSINFLHAAQTSKSLKYSMQVAMAGEILLGTKTSHDNISLSLSLQRWCLHHPQIGVGGGVWRSVAPPVFGSWCWCVVSWSTNGFWFGGNYGQCERREGEGGSGFDICVGSIIGVLINGHNVLKKCSLPCTCLICVSKFDPQQSAWIDS